MDKELFNGITQGLNEAVDYSKVIAVTIDNGY
jgi:hypothetical protein